MADLAWSVTPSSPLKMSETSDSGSNMVRLIEDPEIEKNIKFDEISIPNVDENYTNVQGGDQATREAGLTFPMIRINDYVFARENISNLTISSNGLLPAVSLTVSFMESAFVSKSMPKDGDLLSLFIRPSNAAMQYLRCEFLITSCKIGGLNRSSENTANITGHLFVPGFDSKNNTMGFIGTSKELMKEIARKFGIGFAFNDYDDTNDLQGWILCNDSIENFVNDVVPHIWKDETSFFRVWVDMFYNLCFVNVNKFLLTSENEETIDTTFFTKSTIFEKVSSESQTTDAAKPYIKILSNMEEMRGTPMYISEWHPVNNSANVSMNNGYTSISYSFTHNQNIMSSNTEESFRELKNVPAYDKNKTDTHILLRGRARYDEEQNPDNEQKRENYDFVNTYIQREWCGVEYMIDPDEKNTDDNTKWSGNVHMNYNRAVKHNRININELGKMYLQVTCDGLCLQVMRGERVPVYIMYDNQIDAGAVNNTGNDNKRDFDRFYSGYYWVDSITYKYKVESGEQSPYKTVMTLCRREWPTPEAIEK